jgi:D-beta-D-heptose 7-phosphate kinase/D-beta-D-heptose 1-phosphate adenosyltransferase
MNLPETFSNLKIAVVGDVMLDRYWWGSVTRISPEAPVPVVRLSRTSVAPGGAANVASNIAGLGAATILVGITGKDVEAEILRGLVEENPFIDCRLIEISNRDTTVKTRIVAHDQHVVRIDQETSAEISATDSSEILRMIDTFISDVDVMIISDYAKGFLTAELISGIIGLSKRAGKPVIVDPKGKDYSKYRGATLLTPNKQEAAEACGLDAETTDLVELSGKMLLNDLDLDSLLITRGGEGMTILEKGIEPQHLTATARKVYDVTGAGDTVIATLATAIAAGIPLSNAAILANVAAGIVVEQVGTSSISLTKLRRALDALYVSE